MGPPLASDAGAGLGTSSRVQSKLQCTGLMYL